MMRVVVAFLAVCAVVVTAQRGTTSRFATCTASGDPHFKTFDDVWHDFQGRGVFQALKNDHLNVQYEALPCNPPHVVTCIKRVVVQIKNPMTNVNSLVHWISWPGFNAPVNVDGVNYTLAQVTARGTGGVVTSNNIAKVTTASGQVNIVALKGDWQIDIGQYYLAAKLPFTEGHFGVTRGVCGSFDGNANNEFTADNGTKYENSNYNVRTNSMGVNRWASTYGITGVNALAGNALRWTTQGKLELLDDVPEPVIPTEAETEALKKVPFTDIEAVNQIQERCKALAKASDAFDIENCIYDGAVLGDVVLAASNEAAAQAAQAEVSSDDDSLGAGAIAGIVLGCVAAVTIFVALFLYVRLRKVSAAYERALVVRNNKQDAAATGGVADNL